LETRTDQQQIDFYTSRLKQMGYEATGILGFNRRSREIVRIIKESNADMLVIGAHGHSGIKDWFYGQTIDSVRHELNIPVLVCKCLKFISSLFIVHRRSQIKFYLYYPELSNYVKQ
jgi:manganese transport protein